MRAAILTALLYTTAAHAADAIDMNDPRRALGREDDVRIDASLKQDTVSSGSPISVTYQIQNMTAMPVAIASRVTDVSYDPDTLTIVVGIGSEIPKDGAMPHMSTINPGEKRTFCATVTPVVPASAAAPSASRLVPRYVQVKVSILRDVAPFAALIANQSKSAVAARLSDDQFDCWLKGNDTIFLNTIPVRYQPRSKSPIDVENASAFGVR